MCANCLLKSFDPPTHPVCMYVYLEPYCPAVTASVVPDLLPGPAAAAAVGHPSIQSACGPICSISSSNRPALQNFLAPNNNAASLARTSVRLFFKTCGSSSLSPLSLLSLLSTLSLPLQINSDRSIEIRAQRRAKKCYKLHTQLLNGHLVEVGKAYCSKF